MPYSFSYCVYIFYTFHNPMTSLFLHFFFFFSKLTFLYQTGTAIALLKAKEVPMEKGKIIVLDDDPVVTLSCKRILGAEGYNIITVSRGEEAIKRIEKEEFDLLITDIRLPDASGIDVLRQTRDVQPNTDVVVITGYPT
ncbi:MAG: response regulator, partial [Nitrospirae bacterium]